MCDDIKIYLRFLREREKESKLKIVFVYYSVGYLESKTQKLLMF